MVGSTIMYFQGLLRQGSPALLRRLPGARTDREYLPGSEGWQADPSRLAKGAPGRLYASSSIPPAGFKRATSVYLISGVSLTALHAASRQQKSLGPDAGSSFCLILCAIYPWHPSSVRFCTNALTSAFAQILMQQGLMKRSGLACAPDLHVGLPSIVAVGYRQICGYWTGKNSPGLKRRTGSDCNPQYGPSDSLTWLRGLEKKSTSFDSLDDQKRLTRP